MAGKFKVCRCAIPQRRRRQFEVGRRIQNASLSCHLHIFTSFSGCVLEMYRCLCTLNKRNFYMYKVTESMSCVFIVHFYIMYSSPPLRRPPLGNGRYGLLTGWPNVNSTVFEITSLYGPGRFYHVYCCFKNT